MADIDSACPLGAWFYFKVRRGDHPSSLDPGRRPTVRSTVDGKKKHHRPASIREFTDGLSIPVLFLLLFLPAGCLRPESPRPALEVAREAALETKIRAFIAAEPMLDQERVRVEIDEGKIILKGKVEREEQKEKATEVAVRAGGDLPIKNEIVVQG